MTVAVVAHIVVFGLTHRDRGHHVPPRTMVPPHIPKLTQGLSRAALAVVAGVAVLAASVGLTIELAEVNAPEIDLTADDIAPLEEVVDRHASVSSVVVAADGSVLARFAPERTYIPLAADRIPHNVRVAVIASEDAAFESHDGFDAAATARAAARDLVAGETVQGGSTITQQLAKNLYTGRDRTLERKVRELAVAVELERRYSKDEILAAYLNSSYFGSGAVGIVAAARTYFGKAVGDLSLSEAALLAGVLPSPSERNPVRAPDAAERARQRVLDRVERTQLADERVVAAARRERPRVVHVDRGSAGTRHHYFVDYVRRFLVDEVGMSESRLYGGGLRIETTLDPDLQSHAVDAVRRRLPAPSGPAAAVVVIEPRTGYVRALVGGRNWEKSKVNLALGADGGGTGRQPGSSFKPLVLATALSKGWRIDRRVPAPETYLPEGADKPIRNVTNRGYGELTLLDATVRSVNTAYAYVTDELGPTSVAAVARRFGITLPKDVGVSVGIGAYETSPLRMAAAYAAFAADGVYAPPTPVIRIVESSGEVAARAPFEPRRRAVSPSVARTVHHVLQQVVSRGTGTRADLGRPTAGKTGTSNEYRDAWFVGYTRQLAAAVWVGYADSSRSMRGIAGFDSVTGATVPALLWRDTMLRAHEGLPAHGFPPPPRQVVETTAPVGTRGGGGRRDGDDGDGGGGRDGKGEGGGNGTKGRDG